MKSISTVPGSKVLQLVDRQEPQLTAPDEIKLKITQIGICGTDREIAHGGRADAPAGSTELVLGHEMIGKVIEVGAQVTTVKPGDYALFIVRRDCGMGHECCKDRSDMCCSGLYTERGIRARDGYMAEYVVDKEPYVIKIPQELADIGVLTEPMSVSVKALDEAIKVQAARIPGTTYDSYLKGRKALVVGLGPIGLLGAIALRLRGAEVIGMDIVDATSPRPTILKELGGTYINGKEIAADQIDELHGHIDLIFEAAGVAKLGFELIDALGINGIYVMTGVPGAGRPADIPAGALMQQMVLMNQVLIGSVNASKEHNYMAIRDLVEARKRWGKTIENIITERLPFTEFEKGIANTHSDEIKTILEW
ncbi:MAG: glucose 1-dehydrogenase [Cytophagaceae bacterium]|jgi:threonine dehydrogenase-like Zn-dependent dehydrogenase|nr:glucose 1-dehydrogenase [Cytophagaceae bacterium]